MTIVKDTIKRPGSSAPWPNAKIKVAPAAPFFLDDGTDIRDSSSGQTDSDGLVSFDLAPTPDGFFYWWNYPDGKQQAFTVPATGGPYLLKDVRTSPTPPPGWVPGAVTSVDGETGAIDLSTSYGPGGSAGNLGIAKAALAPSVHTDWRNRPDGVPTVGDEGQALILWPADVPGSTPVNTPRVESGKLVFHSTGVATNPGDKAGYTQQTLSGPVKRIGAEFTFGPGTPPGGPLEDQGTVTMSLWTVPIVGAYHVPDSQLHLIIGKDYWSLTVWQSSTQTIVSGPNYFTTSLAADDATPYRAEARVDGSTVSVFLPGGTTAQVTHALIGSIGPMNTVNWELYLNDPAGGMPKYVRTWASTDHNELGTTSPSAVARAVQALTAPKGYAYENVPTAATDVLLTSTDTVVDTVTLVAGWSRLRVRCAVALTQLTAGQCALRVVDTTYPAWAGSTAYSVGDIRNNGNNYYQATTAGTSAASGGPTGTGSSITDGTVTWKYLRSAFWLRYIGENAATYPAWTASTVYAAGSFVTNGANSYWTSAGGTSAASGGPTSTGTGAIIDGTVTWKYLGTGGQAATLLNGNYSVELLLTSLTPGQPITLQFKWRAPISGTLMKIGNGHQHVIDFTPAALTT